MARVAIVGSRDYAYLMSVRLLVRTLPPSTVVVSGGSGASMRPRLAKRAGAG